MVRRVVDGVNTDGVDSKLLKLRNVTLASACIRDGIFSTRRAAGLVVYASDVKAVAAGEEGCSLISEQSRLRSINLIIPLPLTVTVGRLPELLFDGMSSSRTGVITACATAAEAAAKAIAAFIMSSEIWPFE